MFEVILFKILIKTERLKVIIYREILMFRKEKMGKNSETENN
jgi:hypothetical protein